MNEHERHVKARQQILRGEIPDKRIVVAVEDKKEKEARQKEIQSERDRINEKMDVLKETLTPWFCPKCDRVMKKRLDDKMYRLYHHCFDCQIEFENKMRIDGTFDEYSIKKVLENKKSWIKEQIQSVEEWKEQEDVVFFNQINPDGATLDEERYKVNKKEIDKMSVGALEELNKMLDEVNIELSNINNIS